MANTNHITTKWLGEMAFESNNLSGLTFKIDASEEDGGKGDGLRPKTLMLSSLAGCSGLDVAQMIRKMKLNVDQFHIETIATLTEEHPKTYKKVIVEYHFHGKDLDSKKLDRAVGLSSTKYCGVMEMFRQFAEMEVRTIYHNS